MSLVDGSLKEKNYRLDDYPEEMPAIWSKDTEVDQKLQKKKAKLKRLRRKLQKGKGNTKKCRRKIHKLEKRCQKLKKEQQQWKMNERERMFELQMTYREKIAQARLEAFFYRQALMASGRGDLEIPKLFGITEKIQLKGDEERK